MNPLNKLATSISEMSEAELLEKLRQMRYERRTRKSSGVKKKKAVEKPAGTEAMDTEGLLKLLELLESQIKGDSDGTTNAGGEPNVDSEEVS